MLALVGAYMLLIDKYDMLQVYAPLARRKFRILMLHLYLSLNHIRHNKQ